MIVGWCLRPRRIRLCQRYIMAKGELFALDLSKHRRDATVTGALLDGEVDQLLLAPKSLNLDDSKAPAAIEPDVD